jgi:hypothetical protein
VLDAVGMLGLGDGGLLGVGLSVGKGDGGVGDGIFCIS